MRNQFGYFSNHSVSDSQLLKQQPYLPITHLATQKPLFSLYVSLLVLLLIFMPFAQAGGEGQSAPAKRSFDMRNLSFMRISLEQGLSQAGVNAIAQDQQGFIWFGTQEGLNQYDGHKMQVYEYNHKDPNSLSSDWIWSLLVDQQGVLWAGTDTGGLNRFNPEQHTFTRFQNNPQDPHSLSHDRVRVVYQDWEGTHWIGTDGGGLNRFDPKTGQFVRYQHDSKDPHSIPSDSVLSILEDRSGNLWVGTKGGGLAKMDRHSSEFTSFQHDPASPLSLSDNEVRSIFEDKNGQLWVGTYEAGLNQFNPGTGDFTRFQHAADNAHSLSSNRVRNIFQDKDGTLWIATDAGLNQWLPDTQDFNHYNNIPTDPSSLSDDRLTTMFQDRGGVLWIGSFNGVNKWNYVSDAFAYYQRYGSELRLSNDIVTSAVESANKELWVGTYGGGLNRLNRTTGKVKYYRHDAADPNSLNDDRVMSVVEGPDQSIWVGTRKGGLSRLDLKTDKFTHYKNDINNQSSLSADGVTSILAEENGVIWGGTYGGGLNLGNMRTGQFKRFRHDPNDSSTLSSDRVLAIYRDHFGVLWIGTEDGGLNRFVEETQSFVRYQFNPDDPNSLSNNAAWDILEGNDDSLWIGTGGGGLNRWSAADRNAGRAVFKHYQKTDGLNSDTVQGILEDDAGFLWLSSNRGLQRFDPDTGKVRDYNRSTGLKGNEFNTAARFKSDSGRMYFGGPNGLLAFYPNEIKSNQHEPDIFLSANTRLGPLDLMTKGLPGENSLELGFREDLITFEFAGLDYTAPESNLYRYKLEGFDTDWTGPVSFNRTTYTNLPAGSYTFRVMASNNDGVWNEQGLTQHLQVIPPPWQTGWAYLLYACIAIGSVVFYLRAQARKLSMEVQQRIKLEQLVALRTQEISERNDELQELNQQFRSASVTDTLTGLNNRRYMDEFIESEVALANRQAKKLNASDELAVQRFSEGLSFMMIDLDGFKAINDTYGHHAGDRVLIQVRDILQNCCRKTDTIIRWGGDEFLIVSRNAESESVEALAERIRSRLADNLYQLGAGNVGRLSGSIGFALYPFSLRQPDLISWEQVMAIADRGAYVVKENGRNAWVGIYGDNNTTTDDISRIKSELNLVIEEGKLSITSSIAKELKISGRKAETPRVQF